MKKYLIALDLDGTILYDFDSLSETLCEFMKKLQDMGHSIVIATGRPYRSSKFVYDRFNLNTPIINYNGGLITNPKDDRFQEVNYTIDKSIIIDIFENNLNHIRNAFSEVYDKIYLYKKESEIEPLLHVEGSTGLEIGNLRDTLDSNPNGFIIIGKTGHGQYIKDYIDKKYLGIVDSRIWNLSGEYDSIVEIYTPQSNKGEALETVSKHLGFKKEDIIAIGDGHNDIEMLQYAGLGVAMKNAHPDLLEVADLVLDYTSSENAVYRFLASYLTKR